MGARQKRGGVGTWRLDRKTVTGEGRRIGESQQRAGDAVDAPVAHGGCVCAVVGKEKVTAVFIFIFRETTSY
jgi:hypothetical protein